MVKPIVLVAATSHWFPTARLAMALADAGCAVEAVCPAGHPLRKIRAVRQTYMYRGLVPLSSLRGAIVSAKPNLIISSDDLATRHLHEVYRREREGGMRQSEIASLIERSFGSPESFPIVYKRAAFMALAQKEGVRVPKTAAIGKLEDLRVWAAESGFPAVLKADGTSGGEGVRVVRTLEEAITVYRKLNAPPLLARAVKRAMLDQDKTLIWPSLFRQRSTVSVQQFIAGQEATSLVACWRGELLAALHFIVISKRDAAGPATVMRLTDNPEMISAAGKMVRRLKLSGIHGFDFMLDSDTGKAYLIEINPRATQVGHLTLGPGRDLPASLTAVLTGAPTCYAPKMTERDTIVLFPQEWMRDVASSFIRTEYHDVPWEEPRLVKACMLHALKANYSRKPDNSGASTAEQYVKTVPALSKSE